MLSVEFFVRELPKSTAKKEKKEKGLQFSVLLFSWPHETVPGPVLRKSMTIKKNYHPRSRRFLGDVFRKLITTSVAFNMIRQSSSTKFQREQQSPKDEVYHFSNRMKDICYNTVTFR